MLGWAVTWAIVAWVVKKAVDGVATPINALAESTDGIAQRLDETANQVRDLPMVGEQLSGPFGPLAESVRELGTQAADQVAGIHTLGWLLFAVVFLMPTLTVALFYLPPRIRRGRETAAARRYIDQVADLDLFALRAMSNAPMTRLAQISADPVADWRRGDTDVITKLANLELRRVGIGIAQVSGSGATVAR